MESRASFLWPKALQILGWLIGARRPLTWHEMQAILSFEPELGKIDMDLNMLRKDIDDMLTGLVHVDPGRSIRLVHSTARE